jgi:phosphatidylinositol alpha-1,6-mannosyltransferase
MALFGVPRAFRPRTAWTDARIWFAIFSTLAAGTAFCCWPGSAGSRLRMAQVLVVLPTGAAAIVVGGDDVPVLALSLLALVLLRRRRHAASAVAVALAGLLKLTAWPLMFALAAVGDGSGRRGLSPLALAPMVVVAAVLGAAAPSPAAFADDVVLFPQGLTSLRSPAASTTVGSLVVDVAQRGVATWMLLAGGVLVSAGLLLGLARRPAASLQATAWFAAGILLTLILLAPTARSGYLVYPLELAVWGLLLRERPIREPARASTRAHVVERYAQ